MSDESREPKDYFVSRLTEQLGEMEEEVNELDVKIDESDLDPKLDYEKQIDQMKIALHDARERISELESSGRKGFSALYKEAEANIGDLMNQLQIVRSNIERILLE